MNTTRASLRSDLTLLTQLGLLEARPRVGYYYNQSRQGYDIYMKMIQMSVEDYQSMPVVVNEKASAYDALVSLFINNIGTLFIVNEEGLLDGVLSRKDLLKLAIGTTDMHKVPVSVIMTRMPNLIMTTPDESLWHAAQKLITHEIDGWARTSLRFWDDSPRRMLSALLWILAMDMREKTYDGSGSKNFCLHFIGFCR